MFIKLVLASMLVLAGFSCEQSTCQVEGTWSISGNMFENYEQAKAYDSNRIEFWKDSVKLASGFFFQSDNLRERFPVGRYPFVYYGKTESYKIIDDSIQIRNSPYGLWRRYLISCIGKDELLLIGITDTLRLHKIVESRVGTVCTIKKISAHVYGGGIDGDAFGINYEVFYSNDNSMYYRELDKSGNSIKNFNMKLDPKVFKEFCTDLVTVNLASLDSVYLSDVSESMVTKIKIEFEDGQIINFRLHNDDYPDELRLALINVLYYHQHLVYPELVPTR